MESPGRRVAELHRAFAMPTENPAFAAKPVSRAILGIGGIMRCFRRGWRLQLSFKLMPETWPA